MKRWMVIIVMSMLVITPLHNSGAKTMVLGQLSMKNPQLIAKNGELSGRDEEIWRFSLAQNGAIDVLVTATKGAVFTITLRDGKRTVLQRWVTPEATGEAQLIFSDGLRQGEYELVIASEKEAKYTITIDGEWQRAFESESNNEQVTATKLTLLKPLGLFLGDSTTNEDWLKVTIPKQGVFTLTATAPMQYGFTMKLYDEKKTYIEGWQIVDVRQGGDVTVFHVGVKKATYYIVVEPIVKEANNQFIVVVPSWQENDLVESEPNGTSESAQMVKTTINGLLSTTLDEDWFVIKGGERIEIEAQQSLSFDIHGAGIKQTGRMLAGKKMIRLLPKTTYKLRLYGAKLVTYRLILRD